MIAADGYTLSTLDTPALRLQKRGRARAILHAAVTLGVTVTGLVIAQPECFAGERAKSVSEATGFIQVIGDVHREIRENGATHVANRTEVAFSTGSGFVISPHGYVLTNHHVIRDGETVATDGDIEVRTTTKTSRIEVCLPANPNVPRGARIPCAQASVYFSDPDLDLAILHLGGSDLPYLALGDSDVVSPGQRIDVWGYPFGGKLEVGREDSFTAPSVSATSGSVAALRGDDAGDLRFLQINTNINLGNSGGPVVDQEGFVVGVVQSKLALADGIAFAVPVNRVKTFLEARALDTVLEARRLRLGSLQTLETKAVALRLPEEIGDTAPQRARLAGAALAAEIQFRVDRVWTPWNLAEIERSLLTTQAFESLSMARFARLTPTPPGSVVGRAIGTVADTKREIGMFYSILDLGGEKLIARYVGPLTQLAYNEGVLRSSLLSLEARPLIAGVLPPVEQLEWYRPSAVLSAMPVGWVIEPRDSTTCSGLPPPTAAAAVSPRQDFTVTVRVSIWAGASLNAAQAAAACSGRASAAGQTAYSSRHDWLGVSYAVEGIFIAVGPDRVVQLEAFSPAAKSSYTRAVVEAWAKRLAQ